MAAPHVSRIIRPALARARRIHSQIGKGYHADFNPRVLGNGLGHLLQQFNPFFCIQKRVLAGVGANS